MWSSRFLLLVGVCTPAVALSTSFSTRPQSRLVVNNKNTAFTSRKHESRVSSILSLSLRGGQQEEATEAITVEEGIYQEEVFEGVEAQKIEEEKPPASSLVPETKTLGAMTMMAPLTAVLSSLGKSYGAQLQSRPILTKSVTAGLIFGLSDWTAQRLAKKSSKTESDKKLDWTRILTAAAVGLLYFGPAAHKWYETIFRLLPGTSLVSTLQKATLGQLLFGPSFTCIFFATSLMQGGTFTISNWISKIKTDLPGAWVAGLGFWPLVDLVSFSLVPRQWIPLFVNSCSFFWTIYLSLIANKTSSTEKVA